jgi:hypothetical protein
VRVHGPNERLGASEPHRLDADLDAVGGLVGDGRHRHLGAGRDRDAELAAGDLHRYVLVAEGVRDPRRGGDARGA